MKLITWETGKGKGIQSLLVDETDGQHYVVSSVSGGFADETMIFKADKDGNVTDWSEVAVYYPAQHDTVVDFLNQEGPLSDLIG